MTKNGQCNIKHDAKEKTKRFLQDFFTTIVDMEWHYRNNVEKVNSPHRICMPTPLPQWRLFSLYFTRNFGTGGAARAYLFYWDCFYLVEIFLMLTFIEKIKFWWQDGKICQHWFFILKSMVILISISAVHWITFSLLYWIGKVQTIHLE